MKVVKLQFYKLRKNNNVNKTKILNHNNQKIV